MVINIVFVETIRFIFLGCLSKARNGGRRQMDGMVQDPVQPVESTGGGSGSTLQEFG